MLARSARRCEPIKYYPINETAARRAKEMNSFSDYREGSATAEYRAMVDKAAAVAEHQKARVDPMYYEKIDHLLEVFSLADVRKKKMVQEYARKGQGKPEDAATIEDFREEIKGLGSVNVNAVEEFKEVSQRHAFLSAQYEDLVKAADTLRGIVAELGFKRKEIPYEQPKRRAGKTHNNFFRLYDAAMLSFTSYTKAGLRLATFFGAFCGLVSFAVALVYLVMKLMYWDRFPAGMAPLLIGMCFLGSVQIFFIGLVGEYIMSINTRVMHRPLVIEEERINFDAPGPSDGGKSENGGNPKNSGNPGDGGNPSDGEEAADPGEKA